MNIPIEFETMAYENLWWAYLARSVTTGCPASRRAARKVARTGVALI
jgi:hypothetical protein